MGSGGMGAVTTLGGGFFTKGVGGRSGFSGIFFTFGCGFTGGGGGGSGSGGAMGAGSGAPRTSFSPTGKGTACWRIATLTGDAMRSP